MIMKVIMILIVIVVVIMIYSATLPQAKEKNKLPKKAPYISHGAWVIIDQYYQSRYTNILISSTGRYGLSTSSALITKSITGRPFVSIEN